MSEEETKRPLSYQVAPSPVTRGQFRLLLLLMLIQVVISAQYAYAPGFVAWVKERWAEHRQAVAHRVQVQRQLATVQQCMAFAQPATTVVWDEDPARAAKLLATGGYAPIEGTGQPSFVINALVAGAMARPPALAPLDSTEVFRGNTALVFLHGRRAAGGQERLVVVAVNSIVPVSVQYVREPTDDFDLSIYKRVSFVAASVPPTAEGDTPWSARDWTELDLENAESGVEMPAHWSKPTAAGEPGSLHVKYADQLRVFTGQPDPADASHFTIPYELDGQAGIIDGWLNADGSVKLEPRVGKRVNKVWFPHAK